MTRGRARELGSRLDGLKFSRSGERSRSPDRHQTVAIIRDLGDAWSHLVHPISIVRTAANRAEHGDCADHNRLDLNLTATTNRGRTPRSRRDRASITLYLSWNRFHDCWAVSYRGSGARSTPIKARSWRKSWSIVAEIVAFLEADLKPNSRGFFVELKPRRRTQRLIPTTPSNDLHDRSITHDRRPNFFFKTHVFPSLVP